MKCHLLTDCLQQVIDYAKLQMYVVRTYCIYLKHIINEYVLKCLLVFDKIKIKNQATSKKKYLGMSAFCFASNLITITHS